VNSNRPFGSFPQAAEILDIPLPSQALPHFQVYYQELRTWNKKVNLTAITKEEEIYIDHFIDSLIPEKFIPPGSTVIDLGSGGGISRHSLKDRPTRYRGNLSGLFSKENTVSTAHY